MFEHFPIIVA